MTLSKVWTACNESVLPRRKSLSNSLIRPSRLKAERSLGRGAIFYVYSFILVEGGWHLISFVIELVAFSNVNIRGEGIISNFGF